MAALSIVINHKIGQQAAIGRIQKYADYALRTFAPELSVFTIEWKGNISQFQLTYLGFEVSGNIIVNNNDVTLNTKIPILALPFKSRIEQVVKDYASKILS